MGDRHVQRWRELLRRREQSRGLLVAFEGPDGSGKSTQRKLFKTWLKSEGREVVTVEGMSHQSTPHPLQIAFAEIGAAQCGYCTPGILLAAKSFLDRNPRPS